MLSMSTRDQQQFFREGWQQLIIGNHFILKEDKKIQPDEQVDITTEWHIEKPF